MELAAVGERPCPRLSRPQLTSADGGGVPGDSAVRRLPPGRRRRGPSWTRQGFRPPSLSPTACRSRRRVGDSGAPACLTTALWRLLLGGNRSRRRKRWRLHRQVVVGGRRWCSAARELGRRSSRPVSPVHQHGFPWQRWPGRTASPSTEGTEEWRPWASIRLRRYLRH